MSPQSGTFFGLGIAPGLLDLLTSLEFTVPTPIQAKAIPIGLAGKDVIGVAQTGTGKTLAFGIPMIQRLSQSKGIGLVLVPTRELALQVHDALYPVARAVKMRLATIIGGESMNRQIMRLRERPRIIVATPGRLVDHLEQRTLKLTETKILVLDEADRMLDMGFLPQIERILSSLPTERQTMLFSATMMPEVLSIASRYMNLPVHTEIAPSGTAAELVSQEVFVVKKEDKFTLLVELLREFSGSVLIFVRTKRSAARLARLLNKVGHPSAEIHADRTQAQRKTAMAGFKSGRYRILVATDIAARGIDVEAIEVVINYDLPDEIENYVHRIGRTGRAGSAGHAITLAYPDQGDEVAAIEKFIRAHIPVAEHPDVPAQEFIYFGPPTAKRRSGPPSFPSSRRSKTFGKRRF